MVFRFELFVVGWRLKVGVKLQFFSDIAKMRETSDGNLPIYLMIICQNVIMTI